MTVLVTGASGFLGSHVAVHLIRQGRPVRGLVRAGPPREWLANLGVECLVGDLADGASLQAACDGVEAVVHCARTPVDGTRAAAAKLRVLVEGTRALFDAARARGVARVVHVSSLATIGASRSGRPIDESHACNLRHLGLPNVEAKLAVESIALAHARAGLPLVVVNPTLLVGPRLDGRLMPQVERALRGRPRWVPRGGTSFADVEDVAAGVVAALDRGRAGERYILAGHDRTWLEFTQALARALGSRPPIGAVPGWVPAGLGRCAEFLDWLGLWRSSSSPRAFRAWGWHGYADSGKAIRELGYVIRPFDELVERLVEASSSARMSRRK